MTTTLKTSGKTTRLKIQSLNFFVADLQAGIGPFIGIVLLQYGWNKGLIGSVMTIGGICGVLATSPAGALIDNSKNKKLFIIIPGICTILASLVLLFSHTFFVVTFSQVVTALAGSLIVPAITGITLGIFRQEGFAKQNGINQAFNHAGNMVGAALSGLLAMKFGLAGIVALAILFGTMAIISAISIPKNEIDDTAARGLSEQQGEQEKVGALKILLHNKTLLILSVCLALFHLGNGAMLPMYGLALAEHGTEHPYLFVALTIVVAQLTMVFTSILAIKIAEKKGNWIILLISFISLLIRGIVASKMVGPMGIYPVQILDGIGAGMQSVAVPAIIAHILNGTGRINLGQGVVMTIQGIGAALSPAIGGWMAQYFGYEHTFLVLGLFSSGSILLWILFSKKIKEACA